MQACADAYAHHADHRLPLAAFHLLSTVARYRVAPEFLSQPARLSTLARSRYTRKDAVHTLSAGTAAIKAVPLTLAR